MTPEIQDGDYVKNGESLKQIDAVAELWQNIAIILKTEKGRFYPDKNFGSHILSLNENAADYAAAFARQAVYGIDGVFIQSAKINRGNYEFSIIINNFERQVLI